MAKGGRVGTAAALRKSVLSRRLDDLVGAIAAGAPVNLSGPHETTPLMEAARVGFVPGVAKLLEAGARIDAKDADSHTALWFAMEHGQVEATRALLAAGADRFGHSEQACVDWARDRVDDRQWRRERRKDRGAKALIHAVLFAETDDELDRLLREGANPNTSDESGRTPLVHAVAKAGMHGRQYLPRLGKLLGAGADPNYDPGGEVRHSPLWEAAHWGLADAARQLVATGADVNFKPTHSSPLRHAAGCKYPEVVALLIESGADLEGKTAAEWLAHARRSS